MTWVAAQQLRAEPSANGRCIAWECLQISHGNVLQDKDADRERAGNEAFADLLSHSIDFLLCACVAQKKRATNTEAAATAAADIPAAPAATEAPAAAADSTAAAAEGDKAPAPATASGNGASSSAAASTPLFGSTFGGGQSSGFGGFGGGGFGGSGFGGGGFAALSGGTGGGQSSGFGGFGGGLSSLGGDKPTLFGFGGGAASTAAAGTTNGAGEHPEYPECVHSGTATSSSSEPSTTYPTFRRRCNELHVVLVNRQLSTANTGTSDASAGNGNCQSAAYKGHLDGLGTPQLFFWGAFPLMEGCLTLHLQAQLPLSYLTASLRQQAKQMRMVKGRAMAMRMRPMPCSAGLTSLLLSTWLSNPSRRARRTSGISSHVSQDC